jgi:hypothetical protein
VVAVERTADNHLLVVLVVVLVDTLLVQFLAV